MVCNCIHSLTFKVREQRKAPGPGKETKLTDERKRTANAFLRLRLFRFLCTHRLEQSIKYPLLATAQSVSPR